jgi:hypothetical protein
MPPATSGGIDLACRANPVRLSRRGDQRHKIFFSRDPLYIRREAIAALRHRRDVVLLGPGFS